MPQERRLAAIMVADVVGYSRLVGADESGTLARLAALRSDVTEPLIAAHGGRVFKHTGDGFLVEFASAVQAVSCARSIQEKAIDGPLSLRIGIHLGDVVVQGDDLMGDGVNIAARIEGVAESGGIAISRQVYDQVRDRLDLAFIDKGEIALKNITRPVHVFAVAGKGAAEASAPALALPDKPSIAVLPFQNMSGDAEQEYFVDGLVEDIITALSRFKSLFVIARNSSFTYKGKAVDIKQVGRELGVRYVLEGSVRKAGGRVRITGQLIDSHTGTHVWADHFDGALADIFALQDDVTARVVGALAPNVRDAEIERARRKPTDSLTAYDCYLRALYFMHRGSKADSDEALASIEAALASDPTFTVAAGVGAMLRNRRMVYGWSDPADEAAAAKALIGIAAEDGPDDPDLCIMVAHASGIFGDEPEKVERLYRRGLEMNQNSAWAWTMWANYCARVGRNDEALTSVERARRLSPREPFGYQHALVLGLCAVRQRELGAAETHFRHAVQDNPMFRPAWALLAATSAARGNFERARAALAEILKPRPNETLSSFRAALQSMTPDAQMIEFVIGGLRLAGLPEGAPPLALPDKPSIAVLPFQNMSGDPEQEYFADGMVEDIITALSRFKSLFVIARNSSFTYKGKAVDIKQVGRELGVRYVLEGSVRKAGNRVRITGQLIDCETGAHRWADRFDAQLEDIFELQDEITQKLVTALIPNVEKAEIERARNKPTNLNAYDYYLRGIAARDLLSKESNEQSIRLFQQALALDPDNAPAAGRLLAGYANRRGYAAVLDAKAEKEEVARLVRIAVNSEDGEALARAAWAIAYVLRDLIFAREQAERALVLNPNSSTTWADSGWINLWSGDAEKALEDLSRAMRLDPIGAVHAGRNGLAHAYFFLDRYDEALHWAEVQLRDNPKAHPGLRIAAASAACAGKPELAEGFAARLKQIDPGFRVARLADFLGPYQAPALEKLKQALRLAGLPE